MKKVWKFLSSMQFAIVLLVILAAACAGGSFITQHLSYEEYAALYSERTAGLILALRLDDVFHSWWFLLLAGFLCGNLLLCNLIRLPQLLARMKADKDVKKTLCGPVTAEHAGLAAAEPVFAALRFAKPQRSVHEGRTVLLSVKNQAGHWGAWVCHLGILLLILGFGLGQMTKKEYTVYGVPGQSKPIGDTDYILTIDDFDVGLRDDDTVEQYTADITVRPVSGEGSRSASISVNNPASLYGMKLYQNSTGYAARVTVTKNGEELQSQILCAGEFVPVADMPELVIYFRAFYPDYVLIEGYGPATASSRMDNPGYLYAVYYNEQVLGMNVLEKGASVTIDDYEVFFTEPQSYTLVQIKVDHFTWLALVGGLVTLLGLFLAFYLQPRKLWAVQEDDNWHLYCYSRKGGVLFAEQFADAIKTKEGKPHAEG